VRSTIDPRLQRAVEEALEEGLRRALENSRNLASAHLLQDGIEDKPEASLHRP
jgi:membrane peptidoglycan carboxypeptidase